MVAPLSPRQKSQLIRDFKDLLPVRRAIETRARMDAEKQASIRAAAVLAQAEKELFSRAVGRVKPLSPQHPSNGKASLERPRPAPIAEQRLLDELAVMQEALSDGFDVESLLDADESLSFRRPGIGVDVIRKLRRGNWSIQRQLDLHGFRREDARNALGAFIREANRAGLRCVRVVHGKGLGSPGKAPVLKGKVQSWLVQKKEVLAFVQARPAAGGAGALVVLLVQG